MKTKIISLNSHLEFLDAVAETIALLKQGEVIGLPTETVYGLGAHALDDVAVEKIFQLKGRPASNPIIVHVGDIQQARSLSAHWPKQAESLANRFWPGPLTLVVPASHHVPSVVTAGGTTVGIRLPAHPFMRAVCKALPVAAPSANKANCLSPTQSHHVVQAFDGLIPLVIDGGLSAVGIESTVVDVSVSPVKVLRPGMVHETQIRTCMEESKTSADILDTSSSNIDTLRSPGQFPVHYAPRAQLILVSWEHPEELFHCIEKRYEAMGILPCDVHVLAYRSIPDMSSWGRVSVLPFDPEAYARAIYAELHESDRLGAELIVVQTPPEEEAWTGIMDRLQRASRS